MVHPVDPTCGRTTLEESTSVLEASDVMNYYSAYGWNSWMPILMLVWPLILAAAIWAVVVITRDRPGTQRTQRETAMEALSRRFANGDITQQEYVEARAILKNDTHREMRRA
jgi:uncharacterized membrane protein